jgi:hypothetical protein
LAPQKRDQTSGRCYAAARAASSGSIIPGRRRCLDALAIRSALAQSRHPEQVGRFGDSLSDHLAKSSTFPGVEIDFVRAPARQ